MDAPAIYCLFMSCRPISTLAYLLTYLLIQGALKRHVLYLYFDCDVHRNSKKKNPLCLHPVVLFYVDNLQGGTSQQECKMLFCEVAKMVSLSLSSLSLQILLILTVLCEGLCRIIPKKVDNIIILATRQNDVMCFVHVEVSE